LWDMCAARCSIAPCDHPALRAPLQGGEFAVLRIVFYVIQQRRCGLNNPQSPYPKPRHCGLDLQSHSFWEAYVSSESGFIGERRPRYSAIKLHHVTTPSHYVCHPSKEGNSLSHVPSST